MEIEKTLRWLDPYESWGNHQENYYKSELLDKNKVPDTGLCNRLLHWEGAYYLLSQPKHNDYRILLQKKIWPELEIISLPKTYLVDYNQSNYQWQSYYEYDSLHFKTVLDTENQNVRLASPISKEKFKKLIKQVSDLTSDNHWYSNFGFIPLADFSNVRKRFLGKIKLKHTEVSEEINKKYPKYVGIHIRRGSGVMYNDNDIKTLPKGVQEKYKKYREDIAPLQDDNYVFTSDSFYFSLIKEFLKINPLQKFYISHDLDDEYIFQYYDEFGHHVIETKYNNRYHYEHYYENAGVNVKHIKNYSNAIDNVIDLFSLSSCGMVIGSAHSTWSEFSRDYSDKFYNDTNDPIDDIIDNYKNFAKVSKSAI